MMNARLRSAGGAQGLMHERITGSPQVAPRSPTKRFTGPNTQMKAEKGSSSTTEVSVSAVATTEEPAPAAPPPLPSGDLVYTAPTGYEEFSTKFKLAFALPWRRFQYDSVLSFTVEGDLPDQSRGFFDSGSSIPQICRALKSAAKDPRVAGLCIQITPLAVGWAKLQELHRHIQYFRDSGKFTIAYLKQGGEKEYYLATACKEVYAPPSSYLSLLGFTVGGTFLRGTLDKVGVEPQIKRIGKYKSAGDQLLRTDMSEEQREQLTAILDAIYGNFVNTVAKARGKTAEEVEAFIERGVYDLQEYKTGGWVDGLKYEDELIADLKERTGRKEEEDLRRVSLRRMASVSPAAYGSGGFKKRSGKKIVVLRVAGGIMGSSRVSSAITPDGVIPRLRALAKDKKVAALVLRVDSPGGDAFASDLMWREIRQLAVKKPVIASMGDVAASGGYYLGMAASKIVAEPLTITGSIGVITGKFNSAELYKKIGYAKTLISRGRFAELQAADNRAFTSDEEVLFNAGAQHAYASFRNKAAESRGMTPEQMEEFAQGRVWIGTDALRVGLVDALGGVSRAVAIAKQAAEIPDDESVGVVEVGRARPSFLSLGGASVSASTMVSSLLALLGSAPSAASLTRLLTAAMALLPSLSEGAGAALLSSAGGTDASAAGLVPGQMKYLMTDIDATTLGSSSTSSSSASSASLPLLGDGDSFLDENGSRAGWQEGGLGAWLERWL